VTAFIASSRPAPAALFSTINPSEYAKMPVTFSGAREDTE
jgi:hypothetical protein